MVQRHNIQHGKKWIIMHRISETRITSLWLSKVPESIHPEFWLISEVQESDAIFDSSVGPSNLCRLLDFLFSETHRWPLMLAIVSEKQKCSPKSTNTHGKPISVCPTKTRDKFLQCWLNDPLFKQKIWSICCDFLALCGDLLVETHKGNFGPQDE